MMKKLLNIFTYVIIAVVLIGCSTLSKNECLQADWYEIGRRDGNMGKPRALFQEHVEACVEHNVRANRGDYFRGRDDGLKNFCTYDNGFSRGRFGNARTYVCPPELEAPFMAGFNDGLKVYRYERQVAALEKKLQDIDNQIQEKEKLLYSPKTGKKQRALLRVEIRELDFEYRETAAELNALLRMDPLS
jgi:hypothetical protein